jgi:Hypothetical protein (DUF2513)
MKRDMDLIRELLLKFESWPMERGDVVHVTPEDTEFSALGHSAQEIEYHVNLLLEAGMIDSPTQSNVGIYFRGISWQGHDFLDSVRDPKIWERTKRGAEAAGGFTIDLLKDLATGFVRKQIEERTGVKL